MFDILHIAKFKKNGTKAIDDGTFCILKGHLVKNRLTHGRLSVPLKITPGEPVGLVGVNFKGTLSLTVLTYLHPDGRDLEDNKSAKILSFVQPPLCLAGRLIWVLHVIQCGVNFDSV